MRSSSEEVKDGTFFFSDQLNFLFNLQLLRLIKKTKTTLKKEWFVDSQGFEPQMTEPKSVVLPLHHGSVSMPRNYRNYFKYENLN